MQYQLGFIGAGNMAEAIAVAAVTNDVLPASAIIMADPDAHRRDTLAGHGFAVTEDNRQVIAQSEQVMLAVKPQMIDQVAAVLGEQLRDDQVVISILAGLTTRKLMEKIGRSVRLIRVMPNTPIMVGVGMAGVCLAAEARQGDEQLAMRLFAAGQSKAIVIDEAQMDALTAVSGSGPAYVYYLAEAMEQAAAELGIGEHGRLLVSRTLLGAAQMLAASSDTAEQLRRKVTSPGGTTQAAIEVMDQQQVKQAIVQALAAAEKRSRELGA